MISVPSSSSYKTRRIRIVEPHDYGIRRGAEALLGFQIGGESPKRRAAWLETLRRRSDPPPRPRLVPCNICNIETEKRLQVLPIASLATTMPSSSLDAYGSGEKSRPVAMSVFIKRPPTRPESDGGDDPRTEVNNSRRRGATVTRATNGESSAAR